MSAIATKIPTPPPSPPPRAPASAPPVAPAISIRNLHKSYGKNPVLKGISLSIEQGEVVSVIGPSGTGKSTLLRMINQIETVTSGVIIAGGHDMTNPKTKLNQARTDIGMLFQQFNLFPRLTVLDNITLAPRKVLKTSRKIAEREARALLKEVGLLKKADAYPRWLSGGEQQRVAIARALAMHPKIMLFDEPTSALDPEMVEDVLEIIKKLAARREITILIVTHEMKFAREISDRILFLDGGHILAFDTPENVMDRSNNPRIREFFG